VRIIGIDPGTIVTGYGIVDRKRSAVSFVACGCIVNRPHVPLPVRFLKIHRELGEVLDAYRPAEMAVEGIFFCRNVKTALALGEARGIAMLAAAERGLGVFEYAPRRVKQAILGRGGADKAQVQFMVKAILGLPEAPRPADAADALALALCHAYTGAGCAARAPDPALGGRAEARPARGRVKG